MLAWPGDRAVAELAERLLWLSLRLPVCAAAWSGVKLERPQR
jgi:hypothetical protein